MAALYTSGNQLAASLASMVSAFLCASSLGWPSIFYLFGKKCHERRVSGAIGIVWALLWMIFASNTPMESRWIEDDEKEYLYNVSSHVHTQVRDNWKYKITGKSWHSVEVGLHLQSRDRDLPV